jgi:hypothetical protein
VAFLLDPVGAKQFFLHSDMTVEQQLNSLMRLSVYFALAVALVKRNVQVMLVPMLAALVTFVLYQSVEQRRRAQSKTMEHLHNGQDSSSSGRLCRLPTPHNPFMNVLMSEYATEPTRPRACSISSPSVCCSSERLFRRGVVRNMDDLYGRQSSSRQFYTMPNTTIPNDQMGFAEWLYGLKGPTRKERHASWRHALPPRVCPPAPFV